jgi:rod shape-determining protein MreC
VLDFFKRYRDPLVVLILLILPLVFYLSNVKHAQDYNAFDRAVVFVSTPIQWAAVWVIDGVRGVWNSYVALVGVADENVALRRRVAELEAELAKRVEQAEENGRLRLMLDLRDRAPDIKPVTARIISDAPTPLFRSVRIDRGTDDGVHRGDAVVNQHGVVGRVAAASGAWATVMLVVDNNSSTDVLVQRTRARARVRGLGGDHDLAIKVEYLARTTDVEPGDVLITSGIGSVFPKGLRVGRVVIVERGAFGLYQEALVEPSVDFRRLEEVMVIPRGWPKKAGYEEEALHGADGVQGQDVQPVPAEAPALPPKAEAPLPTPPTPPAGPER